MKDQTDAGSVRILTRDGHEFILEEADELGKEVAQLGSSDKFMRFLKERSTEEATLPFDQIARTEVLLENIKSKCSL